MIPRNVMGKVGFWATVRRSVRQLAGRRMYIAVMILVPVGSALFFLDLLDEGLPLHVPVAVVDNDGSPMSRSVIRMLDAMETVDVTIRAGSYSDALDRTNRGEIFGFFTIPADFGKDAVSGRTPTIAYYCNMAYYVPGSLSFKEFKTVAVSTSGKMVETVLVNTGMERLAAGAVVQPVVVQEHPVGNPWGNYAVYLGNSFIPGILALMVLMMTAWSVGEEIKNGTSPEWLDGAGGSIGVAVAGKLLPQTLVFSVVGVLCQSFLYGYSRFPLNCSVWHMVAAMVLLVVASQSLALIVCCILPNLRLSLSVVSLLGILSFSLAGFSFPVQSMYGAVEIFSYMLPVRHYFLIYADQALNGIPLYCSRWYFVALLVFPLVASMLLWRLKRRCRYPVYVP